jgi:hypothetical protein
MRLFTQQDKVNGQLMTRDTIPLSFKVNKRTIFFVHGWLGSQINSYFKEIAETVLQKEDVNAVVVGWEGGAVNLNYRQSASNTRSVGAEIGLVAAKLIADGKTARENIECVGHSLGAHVCGHAGQRTKLGRITGLDPAGPDFEHKPPSIGLNPDCADYVDAMHTGYNGALVSKLIPEVDILLEFLLGIGFNLGIRRSLGHVDFYPNKGEIQPHCLDPVNQKFYWDKYYDLQGFLVEAYAYVGFLDLVVTACSHYSAVKYYKESILTPYFFSRNKCANYNDLPGSCTSSVDPVQSMGYDSIKYKSNTGIFYLETSSVEPFYKN